MRGVIWISRKVEDTHNRKAAAATERDMQARYPYNPFPNPKRRTLKAKSKRARNGQKVR